MNQLQQLTSSLIFPIRTSSASWANTTNFIVIYYLEHPQSYGYSVGRNDKLTIDDSTVSKSRLKSQICIFWRLSLTDVFFIDFLDIYRGLSDSSASSTKKES